MMDFVLMKKNSLRLVKLFAVVHFALIIIVLENLSLSFYVSPLLSYCCHTHITPDCRYVAISPSPIGSV